MRTLLIGVIGLISFALLASEAAAQSQPKRPPHYPDAPFMQGAPAVCQVTQGVIVIVLQSSGDVTALACAQVNGKPITYQPSLPPGMPDVPVGGDLGTVTKHKSPSDSDPCIEWAVGGVSKYYCW